MNKVLYLNSVPLNSEMANLIQVKAMCKAMSIAGYDVILSLPGESPGNIGKLDYYIDFRKQLLNNKLDKYISIIPLIKSIRKIKPDILFIRDPHLLFYALLFSRKKIIFETHNYILHEGSKSLDRFYSWLIKKSVNKNRTEKLVCISNALAGYWKSKGIPAERIVAAHDGIDIEMFDTIKSKEEVRRDLQLPIDKKIITYSGRLYANRKIDNILLLAAKFPEAFFLVVGGPDTNAKQFKNEAEKMQLSNIKFTGQVKHEHVPDYLLASDILLALWSSDVPTINYCSPLKLFEYMAAKKVIIAHGFPTIKEVLIHKNDALLVEPENFNDLCDKTDLAINLDEDEQLSTNAYDKVVNDYTWLKRVQIIFETLN